MADLLILHKYQFLNSFRQSVNESLIYPNWSIEQRYEIYSWMIHHGCPCYGLTTIDLRWAHFPEKCFLVQSGIRVKDRNHCESMNWKWAFSTILLYAKIGPVGINFVSSYSVCKLWTQVHQILQSTSTPVSIVSAYILPKNVRPLLRREFNQWKEIWKLVQPYLSVLLQMSELV